VQVDPAIIVWLITLEVLYLRAVGVLRGRGVEVPARQKVFWHIGLGLQAIGLLSPIGAYADDLLVAHMAEHLLIADLAAPFLLAGLRNPVLVFFLPRDVLVTLARRRRLRAVFRRLRQPLPAIALYAVVLYLWHFAFFFEAAVRSPLVHALQHMSFIATGMLVWWSALEPKRRRFRGELWKVGHIIGARFVGMFLGMSFVVIRVPVYAGVYGSGERAGGLTALADQQLAGSLMVTVDILLMVFALAFFFFRAGQDAERDEAAERAAAHEVAARDEAADPAARREPSEAPVSGAAAT
jgi:putative copper resistance protein D